MHFSMRVLLLILPLGVQASSDASRTEIQARIKPVGNVRIEQKKSNIDNKTEKNFADSGGTIYEKHCIICHQGGIAGAPKFRDEASWKPRLQGRDINDLLTSAIQGKNAMPARGTCQECNDSDIKAAIEYMVPQQ